ncbi:MAG: FmdB family zinc ribbon protein [Vicinamibacterales bacterium]
MPLYEYQCDSCGHRFEVIRKFSDPPVETCPKCGSPVRKLVASPAFQFKGSGWYITDYAKKDGGGGEKKSGSSTTEAAAAGKPAETKAADAAPASSESTPKSSAPAPSSKSD